MLKEFCALESTFCPIFQGWSVKIPDFPCHKDKRSWPFHNETESQFCCLLMCLHKTDVIFISLYIIYDPTAGWYNIVGSRLGFLSLPFFLFRVKNSNHNDRSQNGTSGERKVFFSHTVLFCGLIYLILHALCGRLDLVPQICFMRVKNSTVTVHYRQHSTYVCKLVRRRRIQMKTYYSPFSRTGVEFLLYFFLS